MSDQENNTLEDLLSQYAAGAETPEGNPTSWLQARTALEERRSMLTEAQMRRLENADRVLIRNASEVNIPPGAAAEHSHSEWWWYLDVMAEVPTPVTASRSLRSRWSSVIFAVLEAIVLLVAVALSLRNFGVAAFSPVPTVTPTASNTPTNLPTATSYPTYTLYPTFTPTHTATVTSTPTRTLSPTPIPTSTPYPTYTLYPTFTPPFTMTPTVTATPTVTVTPIVTVTPTLSNTF